MGSEGMTWLSSAAKRHDTPKPKARGTATNHADPQRLGLSESNARSVSQGMSLGNTLTGTQL